MAVHTPDVVQVIDLELRVKSPLKVGDAKQNPEYDLPLLRISVDGDSTPYIPGSSIKGVLRAFVEQRLRGLGIQVCDILNNRESCGGNKENSRAIQDAQKKGNDNRVREILSTFCIACRIFGSPGYRGRVRFQDAYPAGPTHVFTSVRPGTGVDRLAGSVAKGALFTAEYVVPGSLFKTRLVCRGLAVHELALLLDSLLACNDGRLRIGGRTSVGFGKVRVKVTGAEEYRPSLIDSGGSADSGHGTGMPTTGGDLTMQIREWASKTWNAYMEGRDTERPTVESIQHGAPVSDGNLKLRTVRPTPREFTDPSRSGVIHFAVVPIDGYYIHVGSGEKTVPFKEGTLMEHIAKGISFEDAETLAKDMELDMHAYERFAYQAVRSKRRTLDRRYVIPGSTLKGIFRSRMELLFREENGEIDSCFVIQGRAQKGTESHHHRELYGTDGKILRRPECRSTNNPCVVCDIFGLTVRAQGGHGAKSDRAGGLRSLVEVDDALPDTNTEVKASDVKVGEWVFSAEVVRQLGGNTTAFSGLVRYRNLDDVRLGLLFLAMGVKERGGIRIGRHHYRDMGENPIHFGRARVAVTRVCTDNNHEYKRSDRSVVKFMTEKIEVAQDYYGTRLKRRLEGAAAAGGTGK